MAARHEDYLVGGSRPTALSRFQAAVLSVDSTLLDLSGVALAEDVWIMFHLQHGCPSCDLAVRP
jgi:hypothetical protein